MPGKTVDLPYSKGSYKRQMLREGRWREAMAYREKLKAEGMDGALAWREMMLKFPPSGVSLPSTAEPVPPMEVAEERPAAKQSKRYKGAPVFERSLGEAALKADMRDAVVWTFNTLDVDVQPEDAPTTGAWSLRRWVLSQSANMTEFYKSMASKLLPSRSELNIEDRFRDDGSKLTQTIERLLAAREEAESDVA